MLNLGMIVVLRFSLLHQLATRFVRDVQNRPTKKGPTLCISPALLETYSRLLVYIEIESLGIKGYISKYLHLLSNWLLTCRSHDWCWSI